MSTTESVIAIATKRGWEEINTGGGCTALSKKINAQLSAIIADECEVPAEDGVPCNLQLEDRRRQSSGGICL